MSSEECSDCGQFWCRCSPSQIPWGQIACAAAFEHGRTAELLFDVLGVFADLDDKLVRQIKEDLAPWLQP